MNTCVSTTLKDTIQHISSTSCVFMSWPWCEGWLHESRLSYPTHRKASPGCEDVFILKRGTRGLSPQYLKTRGRWEVDRGEKRKNLEQAGRARESWWKARSDFKLHRERVATDKTQRSSLSGCHLNREPYRCVSSAKEKRLPRDIYVSTCK